MSELSDTNLFLTGEIPRSKLFETLRQLERENTILKRMLRNAEKIAEGYRLKYGQLRQATSASALESERAANDLLTRENAELRKLIEQMKSVFCSMLEKPQCEIWRFESEIRAALEAAERTGE